MTYEEIKNNGGDQLLYPAGGCVARGTGLYGAQLCACDACGGEGGVHSGGAWLSGATVELTKIAGYLHDIGNLVNRIDHSQSGAVMAFRILDHMGFTPDEIGVIVSAIGNHDEGTGVPVSPVAAALILADKATSGATACAIRIRRHSTSTTA